MPECQSRYRSSYSYTDSLRITKDIQICLRAQRVSDHLVSLNRCFSGHRWDLHDFVKVHRFSGHRCLQIHDFVTGSAATDGVSTSMILSKGTGSAATDGVSTSMILFCTGSAATMGLWITATAVMRLRATFLPFVQFAREPLRSLPPGHCHCRLNQLQRATATWTTATVHRHCKR